MLAIIFMVDFHHDYIRFSTSQQTISGKLLSSMRYENNLVLNTVRTNGLGNGLKGRILEMDI